MTTLYEGAFAKLNLTLDVLGKRQDGYHDLRSVMQTVSIRDDIEIDVGTGKPWCLRCGKQLLQGGMYCRECAEGEHVFVRGRSLYQYDSCAEAIYRFKYGGRREYGDYFGQEIAVGLGDFIRGVSPDALVPIPLHKKRFRKRGYNQAKALAVAVSRYTGVPVENNLLVRVKNTRPLKQLNPKERQNNLKKAFKLTENDVKLKTIVLIDDIYTSGSTVDEAARTLKAGGVKDVYVVTLAGGKAW